MRGGGEKPLGAGDPTFLKIQKCGFFSNESACPFLHYKLFSILDKYSMLDKDC
jgi:hypothetical protein